MARKGGELGGSGERANRSGQNPTTHYRQVNEAIVYFKRALIIDAVCVQCIVDIPRYLATYTTRPRRMI